MHATSPTKTARLHGAAARRAMKARRVNDEQLVHRAVVEHLRWRASPWTFWFHPANGGKRSRVEAAILQGLGVVAGVPDLIIIDGGQVYALEIKSEHGRITFAQRECHARMREAGAIVATVCGVDEAIEYLEAWGLLRGART